MYRAIEALPGDAYAEKLTRLVGSAHDSGVEPLVARYRNWRGEVRERRIVPRGIWFGVTHWHPEPQWLLAALDVESGETRDFALSGFLNV